jgi:hypothetical protein
MSVTREDGGKENCLRNRLEKRQFRALRHRLGQDWPVAPPWEALCTPVRGELAFADRLVSVRG